MSARRLAHGDWPFLAPPMRDFRCTCANCCPQGMEPDGAVSGFEVLHRSASEGPTHRLPARGAHQGRLTSAEDEDPFLTAKGIRRSVASRAFSGKRKNSGCAHAIPESPMCQSIPGTVFTATRIDSHCVCVAAVAKRKVRKTLGGKMREEEPQS